MVHSYQHGEHFARTQNLVHRPDVVLCPECEGNGKDNGGQEDEPHDEQHRVLAVAKHQFGRVENPTNQSALPRCKS